VTKRDLESILTEAVAMLSSQGYVTQADWMRERLSILAAADPNPALIPVLDELEPIWGGMGSFSDLPWDGNNRLRRWELCEEVADALDGCPAECIA
jgi:hypothetical protein